LFVSHILVLLVTGATASGIQTCYACHTKHSTICHRSICQMTASL